MKKALVLALTALGAAGVAQGQYSVSTDVTFASKYVFRGLDLADNTLHPSIELSQDQMYLGVWAALPVDNRNSRDLNDEYDFYLGFSPKLSDQVSLDIGATYYYFLTRPSGVTPDSSLEGYVGLSGDFNGITPSFYTYYDFDLENITVQGSLGYSVPLQTVGTSLDLSATAGYVDVDLGDNYFYYGFGASIPYRLNDNATVKVGVQWAHNDLDFADHSTFWYTAGLTVGF